MKTYQASYWILLILATLCQGSGLGQAQPERAVEGITPSPKVKYFARSTMNTPETFRPYMSLSPSESAVGANEYPQVVRVFAWWARTTLKPEYVPSDTFIASHLQLFPATKDRKVDVALLPCHKGGIDYLIAQTGGGNGRVYLFTGRTDGITIRDGSDAKSIVSATIAKFVNAPSGAEIPQFSTLKHGELHSVRANYSRAIRNVLANLEGMVSTDEVGLCMRKTIYEGTAAAHEPPPDQWFEWERQKKR